MPGSKIGTQSVAILLAMIMVLAACGGDDADGGGPGGAFGNDDDSSGNDPLGGPDDDAVDIGDIGTVRGDVDEDFPVALPDGVEEVGFQGTGQRQLVYPNGDFDRLVAFYDDWTGAQPHDYLRQVPRDGFVNWTINAEDVSVPFVNISVERDFEYRLDEPAVTFVLVIADEPEG